MFVSVLDGSKVVKLLRKKHEFIRKIVSSLRKIVILHFDMYCIFKTQTDSCI